MSRRGRTALALLLVAFASFAADVGRRAARSTEAPPVAADPLEALNDEFHRFYARARAERLAQSGPVVVVSFESLTLRCGGRRTSVPFPPPEFQALKQVAHVPLALFVMLSGGGGRPLGGDDLAGARDVRGLIDAALSGLDRRSFPASAIGRQRAILEASRAFLDEVLDRGAARPEALADYARRMGPLMLANADGAADAYLRRLDAQMRTWRAEMTPEEWKALHVVVMSVHMARQGEIAMQYFGRLLGEPREGHRVIFAEGLAEESRALDLLGTHLLDGAASLAFFGDADRLHRDILADGAAEALKSLPIGR